MTNIKPRDQRISQHFARKSEEYRKRIVADWDRQLPDEYRGYTVRGDVVKDRWNGRITFAGVRTIREYLDEPSKFLLLHGPKGLGKSSLAATIGRQLVKRNSVGGDFRSTPMMMQEFSFGSDEGDPLRRYSSVPVLVMDDIGAANEGITPHQQRCLWSLIDARWSRSNRYTILTTNMSIQSNSSGQGLMDWIGESAWDRIQHDLQVVPFSGESMRSGIDDL